MGVLDNHCLVLNKLWSVTATTTIREGLVMISRGSAKGLCLETFNTYTWEDWIDTESKNAPKVNAYIKTPSINVPAPEVIILTNYDKITFKKVRLTKRGIFKRDQYQCQYCHGIFTDRELTLDHVVPKSRFNRDSGSPSTWENLVTACKNCNNKKADFLISEIGFKLLKQPKAPPPRIMISIEGGNVPESWGQFLKNS